MKKATESPLQYSALENPADDGICGLQHGMQVLDRTEDLRQQQQQKKSAKYFRHAETKRTQCERVKKNVGIKEEAHSPNCDTGKGFTEQWVL